jgi:hypothetical protein
MHNFHRGKKVVPEFGRLGQFSKKLAKVNDIPVVENSHNPVTLIKTQIKSIEHSR